MESYTRITVHGAVTGRHPALVNAAAAAVEATVSADVADLVRVRRERGAHLADLVAAVRYDYCDAIPA